MHPKNCRCVVCEAVENGMSQEEAIELVREKEQRNMEKYGWYVHYVQGDGPLGINAHTHGLPESHDHPDLQLVLPIKPEVLHSLFCALVEKVSEGTRFVPNEDYFGICNETMPVRVVPAKEAGRSLLRVILPDKYGKIIRDDMDSNFAAQYNDLS